jgi:tetratricopeptide (TPR) repeat protein
VAEAEGIGAAFGAEEGDVENQPEGTAADVGVALALDAAHHDPALSAAAGQYLNRQRVLVDLQIKHFDEEHALAIAATRRKALIDRTRIGLQLLIAVVIIGVFVGFGLMIWDAANDRGVVIDAISVPEDLARRGFTGEVVAKHILDRLAEINNTSGTIRPANSYSNSLGGGIKLEIPETGISIGELSRMLHEKLGHATHVGGEITRSGDNVTVRIRLGDDYEAESTGPEANLPALVQDASTKIYAQTQAYRYGWWLYNLGDSAAAAATFRHLAATGSLIERVWALHGLAIAAESSRDAIRYDRQVLQLDPSFFLSHLTIAQVSYFQGHDEAGLKEAEAALSAPAYNSGLSRNGVAELRTEAVSYRDGSLGDYQGVVSSDTTLADTADTDGRRVAAWRSVASALIRLHDFSAASDILERLPAPDSGRADTAAAKPVLPTAAPAKARLDATLTFVKSVYLADSGDWQGAITGLEGIRAIIPNLHGAYAGENFRTTVYPLLAEAYARVGRNADADALLGLLPLDIYDGWRARGRIASLRQDYAAADKAFAEAVRQAPSIPHAYLDWGDMLAAQGDLSGAIARYTEANRLGPHWADPLKAWGDVLAKQDHPREALKKYRQALERAPHWAALKTLVDAGSRT